MPTVAPRLSAVFRSFTAPGAALARPTASLGSSLGPLGTGRSYSSAGTGTDRGCPWMTARNRWLGHVGGTAGEDGAGLRRGSDGHQLDRRAKSVLGYRLPRWQVAGGDAAGLLRAPDGRSQTITTSRVRPRRAPREGSTTPTRLSSRAMINTAHM